MKTMMLFDLITSRNSLPTLLGITLFAGVVIAVGMGTPIAAAACVAAMVPFMYLFNVAAVDEQNGWERFRLTLPLTRRQVVYGRYGSVLLVAACALVLGLMVGVLIGKGATLLPAGALPEGLALDDIGTGALMVAAVLVALMVLTSAAVGLPFIVRYGMTKGTRLVPAVLLLALSAGMAFFGGQAEALSLDALLTGFGAFALAAGATVAVLVLYGASALLSARLYEQREL